MKQRTLVIRRKPRVAIVNCDRPDQTIFSKGRRTNLDLGDLSRAILLDSDSKTRVKELEPRVHRPMVDVGDFPIPGEIDGVIIPGALITPTPETISETEWLKRLIDFIQRAHSSGVPILGMCFGHQALAPAFGSKIVKLPETVIIEAGFHPVTLTEEGVRDPLFKGIPPTFQAAFFHYYMVDELPEGAVQLARGENCEIQAFRIGETTWGVQFHPDYDTINMEMLVDLREPVLMEVLRNRPVASLDSTHNCQVLKNFLDIVRERS